MSAHLVQKIGVDLVLRAMVKHERVVSEDMAPLGFRRVVESMLIGGHARVVRVEMQQFLHQQPQREQLVRPLAPPLDHSPRAILCAKDVLAQEVWACLTMGADGQRAMVHVGLDDKDQRSLCLHRRGNFDPAIARTEVSLSQEQDKCKGVANVSLKPALADHVKAAVDIQEDAHLDTARGKELCGSTACGEVTR